MQEIEVIRRVRQHLQQHGLLNQPLLDLYTDAHPTLLADPTLQPFQRFALSFDRFTVHPDLVGRLADGETMLAIEAKGTTDLLRGFAQAEIYRAGFHVVLLAAAGEPSQDLLAMARRFDVGAMVVRPTQVDILELPIPHLPQFQHARSIRRQLSATVSLTRQFYFNLPTHALATVQGLAGAQQALQSAPMQLPHLETFIRSRYPVLPRESASFRRALAEAEKLNLVQIQGPLVRLTQMGQAATLLLPDLPALSQLHQQLTASRGEITLASMSPATAAVLRMLLLQEPVVRFLVDVLSAADSGPLSMPALVGLAATHDKDLTPTIFFKPGVVPHITNDQGHLEWRQITPLQYRTTIYMQWKSWLKHAGLIAPHRLGGTSANSYQPDRDLWELLL